MRALIIIVFSLGFAATGCDKPATKIGTACHGNGDCNVAGQVCVGGICTHPCTGQYNQCPIGYNCTTVDQTVGLTCNKVSFAVDPTSGQPLLFGVSCAANAGACNGTGDPAANPVCRKGQNPLKPGTPVDNDPAAYCTAACSTDNDCPFFMFCGTDYDGVMKCLNRGQCSPCNYSDNCNPDGSNKMACVPSNNNTGNYCTANCNTDNDCPGSVQAQSYGVNNYLVCTTATDSQGAGGRFCIHRFGACVGTGNICDPCRSNGDCAMSGSKCLTNTLTLESMCTKPCTSDAACSSPNMSTCDDKDLPSQTNPAGMSTGYCTGDTHHVVPGDFSCWI